MPESEPITSHPSPQKDKEMLEEVKRLVPRSTGNIDKVNNVAIAMKAATEKEQVREVATPETLLLDAQAGLEHVRELRDESDKKLAKARAEYLHEADRASVVNLQLSKMEAMYRAAIMAVPDENSPAVHDIKKTPTTKTKKAA